MAVKKVFSSRHGREVWSYDVRVRGRRYRRLGFSSKAAAETAQANLRVRENEKAAGVIVETADRPSLTARALLEPHAARLEREGHRRVLAVAIRRWLAELPADLLVTDLKTAHLKLFFDLRVPTVKPQTADRDLVDLRSILSRARETHAELEAWAPPRRPRIKVPTGARDRVIAPAEAAVLLAEMRRPRAQGETEYHHLVRHDTADFFQIALQTAARRMEIFRLRWSDVNFEWRTLRIVGTKTDRVRAVPVSDTLLALFERRRREGGGASPLVFPRMDGPTGLTTETCRIFVAASKAVGIPYGRETPGGWVIHDARHTAITAMLHAGNSLETVMAISGHSARTMAMRYAHANEVTKRAAVSALEQFAPENPSALASTP